ncbi:uncharacterized protein Dwil_GK20420 [Drosophila willistoni]|nr:uncharacterized protein Dwil_GK20420 [Drosophila willistoni]
MTDKAFFVTLAIGFCMVAADVSHLPSSYLPPPKPEHAVSMSIEQQELRELPEQVEYMRDGEMDNSQMDMDTNMMGGMTMPMPSSLLTPPAPVESEADSHSLPTRYLPPAQQMNQAPGQEEESFSQAATPTEPEPLMQPEAEQQQMPMDYMQYLPPAPVDGSAGQQQLTYQQYQEQLQQQQQQQQQEQQPQEYQMPYILDVVQQPMAPSDAETLAYEEPQPAHELRNDGYHYKSQTAEEEQRLRH